MNWTGGHLQRSRQHGSSLTHKQKQYFAKRRMTLQHSPRTHLSLEIDVLRGSRGKDTFPSPEHTILPDERKEKKGRSSQKPQRRKTMRRPLAAQGSTVEEKRQQLLNRPDWVGMRISRPPPLNLTTRQSSNVAAIVVCRPVRTPEQHQVHCSIDWCRSTAHVRHVSRKGLDELRHRRPKPGAGQPVG